MTARIIDGKAIAADLRVAVKTEMQRLTDAHGIVPGLAVVLVGDDAASRTLRRRQIARAARGRHAAVRLSICRRPPAKPNCWRWSQALNADPAVHGILVQLPLPPQIDTARRSSTAIDPDKDVDGFHPINAGRLATGLPALVPCTPLGCIMLAKTVHRSLAGLEAVVVGRSNIVGKPLAQLLLDENATVTVAHSKTRDLPAVCRRADILFAAVGRAEMVRGDWIKPGATVIDVGINRVAGADGKTRIVGDVAFRRSRARSRARSRRCRAASGR